MKKRLHLLGAFQCLLLSVLLNAQDQGYASFKEYAFPSELSSSVSGGKIAWALNEAGRRNVYVAEAPEYKPRMITSYLKDDGQEITSLTISDDGKWVVFVRGGEHSGNWETGLPVNPGFELTPPKVRLVSVPFAGGIVHELAEGDYPAVSPDSKQVAFIKSGQVWLVPVNGGESARNLFTTRGSVHSLEWSPAGDRLLFVANRQDHAVIGIYTDQIKPLKWVAPSFSKDQSPRWSPDGSSIVFVRTPGTGGAPDSMLAGRHNPWSIWTAELATNKITRIWKAPATLKGSFPTTHGTTNLHWVAGNRIVYLSYEDGWPHLYTIAATGGKSVLLTPGKFMVEHIQISSDKKWLAFSANTGPDAKDIERRHIARVQIERPGAEVLTPGTGLEWTPVFTGDGRQLAFLSATAQRPPVPAILDTQKDAAGGFRLIGEQFVSANLPQHRFVTPQQVIFKASDGVSVHADLFLAEGPGRKPTIVYVHGGPPRQMLLGWNYSDYYSNAYASNQYLTSLGFNVLAVNYRLGIGYGYDFHKPAGGGASGASEYLDIKAAGEWLKTRTFTDPARIGIYGGSYGGYLTALALARDSKLFAAGVDIHGVHDWTIRFSQNGIGDRYEKAPDYEKAMKTAWQSSPVSSIRSWTSPVLIIHGDDDRNVQFNQSVDLIRRLEQKGVPMETLMIADDTHHWMKHTNCVDVYQEVANYFIKTLKK